MLIEHCQPAKGPEESCWNFTDDPDERKQRWPVVAQKTKLKDEAGNLINFSEQPLEVDFRAISHWSRMGDWVFVDGFGTGTSFVAALRAGRHAVGTEPDPVQFEAAVNRLAAAINVQLQADAAAIRRRQARLRQKKKLEQKLQEKQQKLKMRKKQQEGSKRKRSDDEEVCFCLGS